MIQLLVLLVQLLLFLQQLLLQSLNEELLCGHDTGEALGLTREPHIFILYPFTDEALGSSLDTAMATTKQRHLTNAPTSFGHLRCFGLLGKFSFKLVVSD